MKFMFISVYVSFLLAARENTILTRLRRVYDNDNFYSKNGIHNIEQGKLEIITNLLKRSLDGIEKITLQLEDAVDLINRHGRKTLVEYLKNSSRGLNMIYLMISEKASFPRSHPQKVYLIVKDSKTFLDDIMYLLLRSLQLIKLPKEKECDDIVRKSIGELADVIFQLEKVVKTLEELGYKTEHSYLHPALEDSEDFNLTQNDDPNAHIIENLPENSNRQNETEKEEVLRSTNGRPMAIMTQMPNPENSAKQVDDFRPQSVRSQKTNAKDVVLKADVTNAKNGNNAVQKNNDGRLQFAASQKSRVTDLKSSNIRFRNNNNGGLQNNLVAKPQITRSKRSTTENNGSQVTMVKPQNNVKNVKAQDVILKPVKSTHDEIGDKEKGPKVVIIKVSSSDSHNGTQGAISKAVDGESQVSGVKSQRNVKNVKSEDKVKSDKARSNVENYKSQDLASKVVENTEQKIAVVKDVNPVLPNEKTQDRKPQCINGILYRGAPLCCVSLTFTISRN